MTELKERYKALIGIRDDLISKLQKQAPDLTSQLKVILSLIDDYAPTSSHNNVSTVPVQEGQQNMFKIVKPVKAVKKVFNDFPSKNFSPPELRDHLQNLKNSGELVHVGKDLLTTTHTVIRGLLKQEFIEKIQETLEDDPTYRLKK